MSRLNLIEKSNAQFVLDRLYGDMERRLAAKQEGICPVDMANAFVKLCLAQSCGKCVPCRTGLNQISSLMERILDGDGDMETLDVLERTARVVYHSSDCAIGYHAARMVLDGLAAFRDDYYSHIHTGRCAPDSKYSVPCVSFCPAGVDIPGYVALTGAGRFADAVRLIRKDNPFPTTCALVCEHPCELGCRRNMIDDAVNIRGLKRYAVEHAGQVPPPPCAPATGKKVAIIGAGPGGLSTAYYLSLMGHSVVVYEKRERLGGMLRYGIPNYRLPGELLDQDLNHILSAGVTVKTGVDIGKDISIDEIKKQNDCLYISIGAHTDKKLGIPGENLQGVMSAIAFLRGVTESNRPDFTGKKVVVVGGGNVAMDASRTAVRLGADQVTILYRRRREDMTALLDEIEGAIAEGCDLVTMRAPVHMESDGHDRVCALWAKPQITGAIDESGRPKVSGSNQEEERLPCDVVIVAIGQEVESYYFGEFGLPLQRDVLRASRWCDFEGFEGVFAGGDCVTGPATAVQAVASGKVAAANIDHYLGFDHKITVDVDVPPAKLCDRDPMGRVNLTERGSGERKGDFDIMERGMTCDEACQEASRCLRCDHFGYGAFRGGRVKEW